MRYKKNRANEKMRESILEAMRLEDERVEEEMKKHEKHVFSEQFEQKMEEIFAARRKKIRRRKIYRYAASIAAVMILVFGTVTATFTTGASMPSIDISGWFEKYFVFGKGTSDKGDGGIAFSEERITYIPEGFVKTEEENKNTYYDYVYENQEGKYIHVRVSKTLALSQQDSEDVVRKEQKGENGYEYTIIEQAEEITYIWESHENLYYYVTGNIEEEELMRIMNSIQEGDKK